MKKLKQSSCGFTLIELMMVITVIAILSTILLFGLQIGQKKARDVQRQATLKGIQSAMQLYYRDQQKYPGPANGSNASLPCAIDELNICGYLTSYPQDPNNPSSGIVDLACHSLYPAATTGQCGNVTCPVGWTFPVGGLTEAPPKTLTNNWCNGENGAGANKAWQEGYGYSVSSDRQSYTMFLDGEAGGVSYLYNPQ